MTSYSHLRWVLVRVAMLAAVAASSPLFYHEMQLEFDNDSFSFGFVALLLCLVVGSVLFALALQYKNPITQEKWIRPSWRSNPFDFRQPVQVFHTAGWIFTVLGASVGAYTTFIGSRSLLCFFPLTIGIGLLVAVKLSQAIFRARFV